MSAFGLIELTRQRIRPSLQSSSHLRCPYCEGLGVIKSFEAQSIELIRLIYLAVSRKDIKTIELSVSPEVASFLQNQKRGTIAKLEDESMKQVVINSDQNRIGKNYDIVCYNDRNKAVKF